MTNPEHFDQVSPVGGMQMQPDGSLQPAEPVPPPGEYGRQEPQSGPEPVWPSLPPQFEEAPKGEELEAAIAAQIEEQRKILQQPAGNVDAQGAPHFQRVLDYGTDQQREVCGQDGQPWPCEAAQAMADAAQEAEHGPAASTVEATPTFDEVASALGVSPEELSRTVAREQHRIRQGLTRDV